MTNAVDGVFFWASSSEVVEEVPWSMNQLINFNDIEEKVKVYTNYASLGCIIYSIHTDGQWGIHSTWDYEVGWGFQSSRRNINGKSH